MTCVAPDASQHQPPSGHRPDECLDLQLTPEELNTIMTVIERDDRLRKEESRRLRILRAELQRMRCQGALRPGVDPERSCARCRGALGRIINRGAPCTSCQARVCKACRKPTTSSGRGWLCTVCHKQLEIQLATGQWVEAFVRRSSRRRQRTIAPTTQLRRHIARSWTLSDPAEAARSGADCRALQARQRVALRPQVRPRPLPRPEHLPRRERRPARRATVTAAERAGRAGVLVRRPKDVESISSGVSSVTSSLSSRGGRKARRRFHGGTPILSDTPPSPGTPVLDGTRSQVAPDCLDDQQGHSSEAELDSWKSSASSEAPQHGQHAQEAFYTTPSERHREVEGASNPESLHDMASEREVRQKSAETSEDDQRSQRDSSREKIQERQRHVYGGHGGRSGSRDLNRSGSDSEPSSRRGSVQVLISPALGGVRSALDVPRRGNASALPVDSLRRLIEDRRRSSAISALSESQICLSEDADPPSPGDPADSAPGSRAGSPRGSRAGSPRGSPVGSPRRSLSRHSSQSSVSEARYRPAGGSEPGSEEESLGGAIFKRLTSLARRRTYANIRAMNQPEPAPTDERAPGGAGRPGESPLAARSSSTLDRRSVSSLPISEPDDDIDRLVAIHQQRSATLSTLGSRSDSLASVYSAGEARYGTVPVRGDVELALQYNYQASALEVTVKQCRDLAAVDTKRNRSDPYVKAYLLPDRSKSGKRKTKTKKHALHPVFEEVLKFPAASAELQSRTLWVTVWHSDIFGRNDFLGEVVLPISLRMFEDTSPRWYSLQERSEIQEEVPGHRGDVIIAFKYTPPDGSLGRKGRKTRGRLHVMIKEAKNLAPVRANGSADPFCKCYLLPDRKSSKQKTPVVKRTTCPRWSGALTYDGVSLGELRERALELTVWDHSITSNEFLGGARFNLGTGKQHGRAVEWMDAAGQEVALWEQMIERPGYWVEGCVPLRCAMERAVPPPVPAPTSEK